MGKFFDVDGPFLVGLTKVADVFILNLLLILCSLPVFTFGAAYTAMYYVTLKMVKDEDCYTVRSFFKSFRQNFKQATVIWLLILAVGGVLALDLRVMNGEVQGVVVSDGVAKVMSVLLIAAALLFILAVTYVFPVLSRFENTTRNTLINSLLMGIRHFPKTILIIIINVAPLVLMYLQPRALILVLVIFGLTAYINSYFFSDIFKLYMPKEEITNDEDFKIAADEAKSDNID